MKSFVRRAALLGALLLCGCQQQVAPAPQNNTAPAAKTAQLELAKESDAAKTAQLVQELWPQMEGVADKIALPKGALFAADLDQNAAPELYILYSTGMGRQHALWALDPVEQKSLGLCYLQGQAEGESWNLRLNSDGNRAVLETDSISYTGAADGWSFRYRSFFTLAEGQLSSQEVEILQGEDGPSYVIDGQTYGDVASYQEALGSYFLRDAETQLLDSWAFEDFVADSQGFAALVQEALSPWQKN